MATPPKFLSELLNARSPTGFEYEAQAVLDRQVKPVVDAYEKDVLGNRIVRVHLQGNPVILFAGHMDELGLMIRYVDEKGFLYFDTLGGHDRSMIGGRRVQILTKNGTVKGVTGRRAVHLLEEKERKEVPEIHKMWIDIGVKNREEALKLISIGDPVVYDHGFEMLRESIGAARGFDDRVGCYVVCEVLKRLAKNKKNLAAQVVAVATTQEEIGTRGATTSAFSVNPDIGIAVDVGHATDHPDCDVKRFGQFELGAGPIISRGPNINPLVFDQLLRCAEKGKIPYQIEAAPRATGTDARVIQMTQRGVATGLVSIPLRYMHTPSELIHLDDIEYTVQLLIAFAKSWKKNQKTEW